MKFYLVTGGAGFIGSHLVESLLATGNRVVVLDNFRTGTKENLSAVAENSHLTIVEGDIRDQKTIATVMDGVDGVFHLAANVSVPVAKENPAESFDINVRGTHNVLEAARRASVSKVVLASSAAVYGDASGEVVTENSTVCPISQYGLEKQILEKMAEFYDQAYGMQTVTLRLFNVFGPRQSADSQYAGVITLFAKCLREGKPIQIYGDGKQTRDFIYVSDVIRALMTSMTKELAENRIFNVATGSSVSVLELAKIMAEQKGAQTEIEHMLAREGDILHSAANVELIKNTLGFTAQTNLRDGLAEIWA